MMNGCMKTSNGKPDPLHSIRPGIDKASFFARIIIYLTKASIAPNNITMKKRFLLVIAVLLMSGSVIEIKSQVYTGGSLGIHFDTDGYYVDIAPLLGYRHGILDVGLSPFFSYRDHKDRDSRYTYGNRVFTQLTFIPNVFAHGEFEVSNIELASGDRKWIVGLPVGGGYRYNLTDRTQAYGMVLYDVLLDEESSVTNPIIRGGVIYRF